ncbi:MAG TPA: asparaginase [Gammaproteobacteria bacterium]|jgi:L-asparaginase II|nr:asparaginase [Acidiferrobacteraceae bacterium]MDP6398810.1 asparaginase [Arenicellales bacterium]MDP6551200.1 asparaginase [Arenicellales bacterium]MDP6919000.1 asparaginase [Arenicellales bacterium]HCX88361.1 asparaginase [Gammaproteobacteria bacterium]|tara:strand:- start:3726 stop:4751 length:1026 start_codon:yes stop_codon:yes gene_type:complete
MNANPVLVEVTRGEMIESRHRGAIAVVRSDGQTAAAIGDVKGLIYPRSAIKPLQAVFLVESGAADAFDLTDMQLALACASHNGEPGHVDAVRNWLARLGLDEQALECGAHAPRRSQDRAALAREGLAPGPAHNNCSGKHCGFLSAARHLGQNTEGYIRKTHPVQRGVLDLVGAMAGVNLNDTAAGIDGCGIPVAGIALEPLALAFSRFATGVGLGPQRQAAAQRIYQAMVEEPFMVAGTRRWCTRAIAAGEGAFIVKTGAEGVYCGAVPQAGVGIALKIDDGARRAAECAMGAVLSGLGCLHPEQASGLIDSPVSNVAGREVGEIRPALELSDFSATGSAR